MKRKFWHRLTFENQQKIFAERLSTKEWWERFKAPIWCGYHYTPTYNDHPPRLCMSLIKPDRKVISKKSNCSKYPFFKK